MSTPWNSLYLKSDENTPVTVLIAALLTAFETHGYVRYDPFPGGSGTPPRFKNFIKHFVAPTRNGWTQIYGEPDAAVLLTLSETQPVVRAYLEGATGGWQVIVNGTVSADLAAFAAYLKPDKTLDDLRRAQAGHVPLATVAPKATLPPDVEQLARDHKVNTKQADKMMERMTSRLFGQLDRSTGGEAGAMQNQARALVSSGVDWNSEAGRRVRAAAEVLDLPARWNEPDWTDIRDAYQAARMLARNAKATLLPGEREALKAIPNAGNYVAVYVGKP